MSVRTLMKKVSLGEIEAVSKGTGLIRRHVVIPQESVEAYHRANRRETVSAMNHDLMRQILPESLPPAPSRY